MDGVWVLGLVVAVTGVWVHHLQSELALADLRNHEAERQNRHLQAELLKIFYDRCSDIETYVADPSNIRSEGSIGLLSLYLLLALTVYSIGRFYQVCVDIQRFVFSI